MRLGLYGGSFDPVHLGHLLVARAAVEELSLDRLVFLPASQSPFKPDVPRESGVRRLRLLRLALAGESRFVVDDQEIGRAGVSYSVDTVRAIRRGLTPGATLFWLLGADQVAGLPFWRESAALSELVEFVVIPRPGSEPPALPPRYRLHPLCGWPMAVSSSEIRERIGRGLEVRHLLPPAVAEAIAGEGWYRGGGVGF